MKTTKLIARIMVLVLLLTSVLSFAGCEEVQVKKGQNWFDTYSPTSPGKFNFKLVADTEYFPLDDVTFNMYIELNTDDVYAAYDNYYYVMYVIYGDIYSMTYEEEYKMYEDFSNYEYIHILKEIPCKETVNTDEYKRIKIPFLGNYYKHCEKITIPKECFIEGADSEKPAIVLGLAIVEKRIENGVVKYCNAWPLEMSFYYRLMDNDIVRLVI